jgi:hypothetical protein
MGRINRLYNILKELRSLPEATVRIYGNDPCWELYKAFTKPHPKYKLIQHKRWGVALIPLPDSFEEYIKGKGKYLLRSNIRKVKKMQFYFDKLNPSEHIDEIMSINTSVEVRQGRPMNPNYLLIDRVKASFEHKPLIYGVFDKSGVLKAYADTPIYGEVFLFSRLLGHGDDVDKGIMYFLIGEVIQEMIDQKQKNGVPLWAMYDTFLGAPIGLRHFKKCLGFKPYKVRWVWGED